MKKFGMNAMAVLACLALAIALGWSALPTNADAGGKTLGAKADGDTCPLKAAAAAKAGTCNASKAAAGTCSSAKNASLAKAGTCDASKAAAGTCSSAKNASLAKEEGGCCADKAAKPAVNTDGSAKAEALLAEAGKSGDCAECPYAAKAAKAEGDCCKDGAAKQAAAKDGACSEGECKTNDIAKLVKSDSRFTTLALAVKAAGMEGEFACPNPKTVLAPTNEAFQKIPAEQWAAILQDDAKLKALVANHIIKGAAMKSSCLTEAKTAKSASGAEFAVSQCPVSGKVSVSNADIVGEAMVASNGNVLAIDNVLMPEGMQVAKAETEEPVQVAAAQ